MEHQSQAAVGFAPSLYSWTLDDAWRRIQTTRTAFRQDPWYDRSRFQSEIASIRTEFRAAMSGRETQAESASDYRDFHYMNFLSQVLEATVYGPHLFTTDEENFAEQRGQLAMKLQRGATKALIKTTLDRRHLVSHDHRSAHIGLANELVPIALLNRPVVVEKYNTLVLPAHRDLDLHWGTDLQAIPVDLPRDDFRIQVKTKESPHHYIRRGVAAIYARDFGNEDYATTRTVMANYPDPKPDLDETLNKTAINLAEHIGTLQRSWE